MACFPTLAMALGGGARLRIVERNFLVAVLGIQPIVATLILMVAGRGIAQLITEGAILTFNHEGLIFFGSGSVFTIPTPVIIGVLTGAIVTLIVRRSALRHC